MNALPWLLLLLGAVARIFLPFLIARRDDPGLQWAWRLVIPQLLSLAIFALLLPLLVDDLKSVSDLDLQYAWLVGYGAASFGRLADQGVEVLRNGR